MHIWKTLKVFVSSTFKDLELERDKLAQVFHLLKEEVFSRQLSLVPYDLRWRDRHEDKDTVKWCLEMVERCQYFVNILGYRYGWRPEQDTEGNANERRISITHMEIEKAIAVVPREKRFFCLGNIEQYSPEELARENQADIDALEKLKKELQASGERVFVYNDFEQLWQIIYSELKNILDADFPPGTIAESQLADDNQALQDIIEEKKKGFVGRDQYLRQLHDFVDSNDRPNYLAIKAVAGVGKSSLLAHFIEKRQKDDKLCHFMAMSSDSHTVDGITRNLSQQLKNLGILARIAEEPAQVRMQMREALEKTDRKLLLIIDGLDEISESGKNLLWLSANFPANVRVIVSSRPAGPWHKIINYPHVRQLELEALTRGEIGAIIQQYREQYRCELSDNDREQLCERASGNPLFLKVVLDEILSTGIAVGQLATGIEDLFRQILQRLQKRYGEEIIRDYLGFIAAARSGLCESELKELLTSPTSRLNDKFYAQVGHTAQKFLDPLKELQLEYGRENIADYFGFLAASRGGIPEDELRNLLNTTDKKCVDDEFFVRVSKTLENFIVTRAGMHTFFHQEFERSIKMWLGKSGMREFHRRFADYLKDKGYGYTRTLSELPYQEQWAERQSDLLDLLTNIEFLQAKCQSNMVHELAEDLRRALKDKVVGLVPGIRLQKQDDIFVTRESLRLLEKALGLEIQFLRKHPDRLLQTLWNRCYWHDCPEAAEHYIMEKENQNLPWVRPGDKIYPLVEWWRQKEQKKTCAMFTRKPLLPGLDAPLLKTLQGHAGEINCVDISADGAVIATAGKDHVIKLWDFASGECLQTLEGHEKNIEGLAFSADGALIASGSWDTTVRLWDVVSGECMEVFKGHEGAVTTVIFSSEGDKIISGSEDKTVRLWQWINKEEKKVLVGHHGSVLCLASNGNLLASGAEDHNIQIWDLANGTCIRSLNEHENWVRGLCFSPDGSKLVSVSEDKSVRVWQVEQGKCLYFINGQEEIYCAVFSPDNKHFAIGTAGYDIDIFDIDERKCVGNLTGHQKSVYSIAYSADGHYLLSASSDKTVRIWDSALRPSLPPLQMHRDRVTSVVFSPKAQRLVSTSYDQTARVWDSAKGCCLHTLTQHKDIVGSAAFSSGGEQIATGSFDNDIRIWSKESGECLNTLQGHNHAVLHVTFSADDKTLLSASYDRTLKLWGLESGECIRTFSGHRREVQCAIFAEGHIVSCSSDNTIKIWEMSGNCLHTLEGHTRKVYSICYDEGQLKSYSEDGTFRVWNMGGECLSSGQIKDSKTTHLASDQETVYYENGEPRAFFFEPITDIAIGPDNIIYGGNRQGYVYLLKITK